MYSITKTQSVGRGHCTKKPQVAYLGRKIVSSKISRRARTNKRSSKKNMHGNVNNTALFVKAFCKRLGYRR